MIKIRYFGSLKETLNTTEEQLDWQKGLTTDKLLQELRQRDATWAEALAEKNVFRLVVNQQVVYQPVAIKEGDEVAVLPPVTGG
ncbi:molybdopterin converting factor subunit 1 [Entomomonas asaccharolytica]|uniref:Molybdopterin synthase sulfur carrier subunit n=1 Tax=Entomomonas asaccharolytica TaxID=2785331 RepID=A0A974NHK9_9GAMM|nr:molybdopterin converting factor subunit 1 [Entomomonas asaccharolytica]QQP86773.1 molybdopterin converting factor subunit 1 [Entomomonas asaccharolytica]